MNLCILALTMSGCVRWGVDDDDASSGYDPSGYDSGYDDGGYDSNDDGGYDDSTTSPGEEETSTTDDGESTTGTDGEEGSDSTGEEVEPWPLAEDSAVVVWGRSGVPSRNIPLYRNVFTFLAEGPEADPPDLAILWIGDCDPREDALGCLEGNTTAFFDMVDGIGVVDFRLLSEVDPAGYDVVVADFCGPVSAVQIGTMLGEGARVMVLGDRWCHVDGESGAERANELLERIGTSFTADELYNHEFRVDSEDPRGLLAGLTELDAWGVTLQATQSPFEAVTGTGAGAVLSVRGSR